MSINLGSNPFGLYLGSSKIAEAYIGSTKIYSSGPVVLPDKTIRFKFSNTSYTPTSGAASTDTSVDGTWTAVNTSQGIWDWTLNSTDWGTYNGKFHLNSTVIGGTCSILQGNLNGVTNTKYLFINNNDLISVANLTNTSSISNASGMFSGCSNIQNISDIDLSGISDIFYIFSGCEKLTSLPNLNINNKNGADITYTAGLQRIFNNCYLATNVKNVFDSFVTSNLALDVGVSKCSNMFSNAGRDAENSPLSLIPTTLGGTNAGTTSKTTQASYTGNVVKTFTIHPGDTLAIKQKSSTNSNVVGVTLETTAYSGGVIYPDNKLRTEYTTHKIIYSDQTIASGATATQAIRFNFGYAYSHTNTIKITCTSTKARTIEITHTTYSY